MATTNLNVHGEQFWRGCLRVFINIFRGTPACGADSPPPPFDLWGVNPGFEDDHRLREAIMGLRMAGNYGESYQTVAERVEREEASYREFLQNPRPIGKISLRTKILDEPGADETPCRVYQVRDPAEGMASVFYTFNRSDKTVLEFIVHDEHDRPLFPLVRTYSDWLGKRKFNLGLDRIFSLRMAEGDSPNVVRVQASFVSAREDEVISYESGGAHQGLPLAAGTAGANYAAPDVARNFSTGYGMRLGFFGAQCLLALFVSGLVFWQMKGGREVKQPVLPVVYPATVEVVERGGGRTEFLITSAEKSLAWGESGITGRSAGGAKNIQSPNMSRPRRKHIPAVSTAGAADPSPRSTVGRCRELLANLRKAVSEMVHFMSLPVPAPGRRPSGQPAGALTASTPTVDAYFGRLHVTFLVRDNLLPLEESACLGDGDDVEEDFASKPHVTFLGETAAGTWGGL